MRILGIHSASYTVVRDAAIRRGGVHDRFLDLILPAIWNAATEYVIDGVGMVAQAGKETGWGNFSGKVTPEFHNTSGIKIRYVGFMPETMGDQPLAHAMFPSWQAGAVAQAQHLRAYAGAPVSELIIDPRYWLALKAPENSVQDWYGLGGKWAPSQTYGQEIETIMRGLSQ